MQVYVLSNLRVFLDVLKECIIIIILSFFLLITFWFLLMEVVFINGLLVQVLELPDSSLLSLTYSWEAFSDNDHIREVMFAWGVVLVFLKSDLRHLVQIIGQHSVVIIDKFSKVGVGNEGLIRLTEIRSSSKFKSDHFEFLPGRSFRGINVEFDIFNI